MKRRMSKRAEDDEISLGQDEVMTLEKLSRDQRMNLNDSVFNLMLSQMGGMDKLSEKAAESDAGSDSDNQSNKNGLPKDPKADEEGSPEALTRKDTRLLNIVRVVSLGIVLLLAAFAVTFVFRYTKHAEDETFRSEFQQLGDYMVESFLAATRAKLMMSKSVAQYMEGLPHDRPLQSISQSQFERFVRPQQVVEQAREVAWSPLVRTDTERILFESQVVSNATTSGPYPACYFCGDDTSSTFLNADDVVSLPGFGSTLTCEGLEQAGWNGEIPSNDCDFFASLATGTCQCGSLASNTNTTTLVANSIFRLVDGAIMTEVSEPPLIPIGLLSTTKAVQSSVMYNQLSDPDRNKAIAQMVEEKYPVFSHTVNRDSDYFQVFVGGDNEGPGLLVAYPVFVGTAVVGAITSEFGWEHYIPTSGLPPKSEFVRVVVRNTCGQDLPFHFANNSLHALGEEDLHGPYENMVVSSTFADFDALVRVSAALENGDFADWDDEICRYKFEIHATEELHDEFSSHRPGLYASFAAAVSGITIILFTLYDCFVRRRQKKMLKAARKSTALIASLFPKMVRDQIVEEAEKRTNPSLPPPTEVSTKTTRRGSMFSSMTSLNYNQANTSFLREAKEEVSISSCPPIATLFEQTTVMFLDLAGFTAWSSEREPNEVFLLLETIYQSFDEAAARKGVFKIETIGDCYVAVTGVPDPMEEHAVVMAKFAQECMRRMKKITKQLELQLGPSTADLDCRVGLHSGSVTGGVLRGEKARFQLFGDTMNTAARMESTGLPGYIQASSFTADLIIAAGRQNWVIARPDMIEAKGKGRMQTYWINPGSKRVASRKDVDTDETRSEMSSGASAKLQRLVTSRGAFGIRPRMQRNSLNNSTSRLGRNSQSILEEEMAVGKGGGTALDEYTDIIDMPKYDAKSARKLSLNDDTQVELTVKEQLREYVTRIAAMYRDVPFHNFEHASHVAMAASKLLKRMLKLQATQKRAEENLRNSHLKTYGISSDPLMQFTLVFAALIHDVDHTGLRNKELVQKRSPAAVIYKNKSVAEQNSLDVAWRVLMDADFAQLRECIYTSKDELRRFRQLLVNAIIATDFADEEAQQRRHARWEKAFEKESDDLDRRGSSHASKIRNDMRATVLYEHIMQAADISHAIQHWQTYSKFHERQFSERFTAFMNGDEAVDPSLTWYEDQLQFFDETVIPLAGKLRSCEVFGSTGDEFVRWAEQNRNEWASKGKSIIRHMRENVARQYERMHAKERRRRGSII